MSINICHFDWYHATAFLMEVQNWPVKTTYLSRDSVTLWGCSLFPMSHCCLIVIYQLGNGSFLPTHMGKNEKVYAVFPKKISCQNQSKSSTTFLTLHTTRATHYCECSIWPWFARILCFSCLCVKFQPSQRILTLNFDQFPSSFNFERGVKKH